MSREPVWEDAQTGQGMNFRSTPIGGIFVVERTRHTDERGSFERLFGANELHSAGVPFVPKQVNRSVTARSGTLRGMHFQYPPHSEVKLVACTRGAIYDVVVDLRPDSPTFLSHWGTALTSENATSILVPTGLAHGFVSTEDDCEVVYVASEQHAPAAEDGIRFDDEFVRIEWPVEILQVSEKDASWLPLTPRVDALRARFRDTGANG